mmetsp:Transcript_38451/g.121118  ORF Transcript_38451/g.121118 Transcript_38451/m.121118 type:complete len:293 (+) Transcript_38451:389-1267(+)
MLLADTSSRVNVTRCARDSARSDAPEGWRALRLTSKSRRRRMAPIETSTRSMLLQVKFTWLHRRLVKLVRRMLPAASHPLKQLLETLRSVRLLSSMMAAQMGRAWLLHCDKKLTSSTVRLLSPASDLAISSPSQPSVMLFPPMLSDLIEVAAQTRSRTSLTAEEEMPLLLRFKERREEREEREWKRGRIRCSLRWFCPSESICRPTRSEKRPTLLCSHDAVMELPPRSSDVKPVRPEKQAESLDAPSLSILFPLNPSARSSRKLVTPRAKESQQSLVSSLSLRSSSVNLESL